MVKTVVRTLTVSLLMAEGDVGSARRRRERRLRSFLRHERMTVRMELAAALHHSSFRGAGPEMYDAPRRQRTANSRVGPAEYHELSSDGGRPTGEERPAALSEPWPQGKVERHDGIAYELVHRLDVPVPQMGEQLPNVVQFFSALLPVVAEPVIEVPKILLHDVPLRRLCRETQLAEQLVEVPTVLSYSSLQQLVVEQTVDIPVPGRAGGRGREGLQGFSGQGSTASSGADRVDIPVPRGGGLQGSRPGQGSSSSSRLLENTDDGIQGVFSHFSPREKSVGLSPHSGSELSADFNPSTLSAHQMPPEQLVDVPVPQVSERSSRSLLHEVLRRRQEAEEAARWREQNALLEEEDEEEEEDDEEEEFSRFPPHFRPRRWCQFLLAGSICPRGWQCTFAHMSQSCIRTHGSARWWWVAGVRVQGLASPDPFLGASMWCVSTTNHGSCGGGSTCAYWRGTDRDMPLPQIMPVRGGGQFVRLTSTGAVLGQGC